MRLKERFKQWVLVGEKTEHPNKFYIAAFENGLGLGLITTHFGIEPRCFELPGENLILIGHGDSVTAIKHSGQIHFNVSFVGSFYEFLPMPKGMPVIIHEIGALRVSKDGVVIWAVDTDIVEDFGFTANGCLKLKDMDGYNKVIDPETGSYETFRTTEP